MKAAWWLRVFVAGARVQAGRTRGSFFLLAAVVTPVAYAVIFLLMAQHAGAGSAMAAYVVIGPALIGVWYSAIATGAAVVGDERSSGTLELLFASPAPASLAVLGRVSTNTVLSLVSIPLVVLTARMLGVNLIVTDWVMAVAAVVALGLSVVGITLIFTSTFVLARSAGIIQNLIPFPLYILSGIAFPLTLLPDWIRPLSGLIPITYVADALRIATAATQAPWPVTDFLAIAILSLLYCALGLWLFARIERSVRRSGKISLSQ